MVRIPRVRFTIRRLMIAVAVIGVGLASYLGIDRLNRRSTKFRRKASVQKRGEAFWISQVDLCRDMVNANEDLLRLTRTISPDDASRIQKAEQSLEKSKTSMFQYQKKADYCALLHEKYLRAAASPWKFVDPDPPEPD